MSKIEESRSFLQEIGMPKAQQADICCLSLLAMAGITEDTPWEQASNEYSASYWRLPKREIYPALYCVSSASHRFVRLQEADDDDAGKNQ